jgi:solute carrier family 35 protein E3
MQLLLYQAPLSAAFLGFLILYFEPIFGERGMFSPWPTSALVSIRFHYYAWLLNLRKFITLKFFIFGSGFMAFFVNLSIYMIIGHTSALT